jgi:hypothetical protein
MLNYVFARSTNYEVLHPAIFSNFSQVQILTSAPSQKDI